MQQRSEEQIMKSAAIPAVSRSRRIVKHKTQELQNTTINDESGDAHSQRLLL